MPPSTSAAAAASPQLRAVVLGASGFLGRHLVCDLAERGYTVVALDLRPPLEPFFDAASDVSATNTHENGSNFKELQKRVTFNTCDITASVAVLALQMRGAWAVFHCASPHPNLNDRALFYKVNVDGTRNVIKACLEAGVKRLILTSSCSVLFDRRDLRNADESTPYTPYPQDYYTETKIIQEKEVLAANSEELMTTAIRPHGIFGPGDLQLLPVVYESGRAGKLKFTIGDGSNLVDFTYVRNVTLGHILAAEKLGPSSVVNGRPYIITNDAPIHFWSFMSMLLRRLDLPTPSKKLPYWLVYGMSLMVMFMYSWILRPLGLMKKEPTFSPMRIALAGRHHYYSCKAAVRDLGYKPVVGLEEGVELAVKDFEQRRNKKTK